MSHLLLPRVPPSRPATRLSSEAQLPEVSAAPHTRPPELKPSGSAWCWPAGHTQGRQGGQDCTTFTTIASLRLLTGQGTARRSHVIPGRQSCFHVMASVLSAPENMGGVVFSNSGSFFSRYMSGSGVARSDGSSVFSTVFRTVLHSGCTVSIPATVQGGLPWPHALPSTYYV